MTSQNRFAIAEERARFRRFSQDLETAGRSPATLRSYSSDWQDLSRWYRRDRGCPFDAARLDSGIVSEWRDAGLARGRSASTVSRRLSFARRYSAWLANEGVLVSGAASAVRQVGSAKRSARALRVLGDMEVHRLLEQVDTRACLRDHAIVLTLLDTGIKVGELTALDVADVDLVGRRLRVVAQRRRHVPLPPRTGRKIAWSLAERGLLAVSDGKEIRLPSTGSWPPDETLPIDSSLRSVSTGRPSSPAPFAPTGPPSAWPLFVGERGRLTSNAVQRIVRKYCTFARVDAAPHILRHTFAAAYWSRTHDLVRLAEILGHENVETTRIYSWVTPPDHGPAPGRGLGDSAAETVAGVG